MKKLLKAIIVLLLLLIIIIGGFCIYVTQFEKRSVQSKTIEMILHYQKWTHDPEATIKFLSGLTHTKEKSFVLPDNFKSKSKIDKRIYDGMDCYLFNPDKMISEKRILYIHGGAYVFYPSKFILGFIDRIAQYTGAPVFVPIYPKAPFHNYKEAFEKILALYKNILNDAAPENITIMGESAGGGFTLAFAQMLKKTGLSQPKNLILISPFLDITLKNPEAEKLESVDAMLRVDVARAAGKAWAGDTDPGFYMLSPINGDFQGLGKIALFIGTHEILLPDSKKLRDIAANNNVDIDYYEYSKMNHVFPVYPTPEGRKATGQIVEIINGKEPAKKTKVGSHLKK